MTRDETKQILMRIQSVYPNWKPEAGFTFITETWWEYLGIYTYEQVKDALKAYILTDNSGFAPSVGQIIEKLQLFMFSGELNEMEAWNLTYKAICNSAYCADEEFARLPELVQKAVVNPGQLREWGQMDIDVVNSVIQSNFMRSYRAELAREKELRKLSPDMLRMLQKTEKSMAIPKNEVRNLTVSEERKMTEQNAVPMPEKLKMSYARLMGV